MPKVELKEHPIPDLTLYATSQVTTSGCLWLPLAAAGCLWLPLAAACYSLPLPATASHCLPPLDTACR